MTMTPERARELIGHTPGPWDCHYGSDAVCQCKSVVGEHGGMGSLAVISVDNGLSIGEGGNDAPDEDQAKANARLIAAAPDLLAGYLALAEENERLRAKLSERDPIGAAIMRERAIEVLDDTVTGASVNSWVAIDRASNAIKDLPLPTHAELLAHALTLPEIKALVAASILSKECFEFQFGVFRRYGCDFRMITPIKQLTAALAQMEVK